MSEYNPDFSFRVPEGSEAQWFLKSMGNPGFQKFMEAEMAKYDKQETEAKNWRDSFKSLGQLADGDVQMLIKDFLPEGSNLVGGLSGHGKTWFVLSIVKALTTGCLFLGKYEVVKKFPVLYLNPESSGNAFKARLKMFGIPDDETRFLCRTISEGAI